MAEANQASGAGDDRATATEERLQRAEDFAAQMTQRVEALEAKVAALEAAKNG